MQSIVALISSHGTRILAGLQGTIVVLLGTDIIPPNWAKYFIAATAVLTYWRGQSVSNSFNSAVAAKSPPVVPFSPPQVK
jgi:hypothetical protein